MTTSEEPPLPDPRMTEELVTVVVVNWNGKRYLEACLNSLRGQAYRRLEVILVDNGSTDDSLDLVARSFPEVKVIALHRNAGFGAANNVAIRHANSRYVALLNNDTEADPNWIAELVGALEQHPEIGFCASKMLLHRDRKLIDACGDFYTVEGFAGNIGHLLPADHYREPVEVFGACAGAVMYRRSVLEDIGPFDEEFFLVHEDTDLNFRACLLGHRCLFVPTAVVYHHVNATIGTGSDLSVFLGSRNTEYVYFKNMPTSLVVRYAALHLAANGLLFLLYLSWGKGWPFLKGKLAVFAALRRLLRERRRIQGRRRLRDSELEELLTHGWLQQGLRRRLQRRGAAPLS